MALNPGTHLGPYEILSPLGAGGMGEVYKARDTRLDRFVAVKVLPEHIAKREDLRQRFEREARAVASLNHPHICVLHDIGNQDGTGYMVMEHFEGETLAARIVRKAAAVCSARCTPRWTHCSRGWHDFAVTAHPIPRMALTFAQDYCLSFHYNF